MGDEVFDTSAFDASCKNLIAAFDQFIFSGGDRAKLDNDDLG
jgi:hypothetical protein